MHAILSSLAAFAKAGFRPRTPLARGIAMALGIKICVVVAMRLFLFGGENRVIVDESVMDSRLIPPAARSEGN